MIQLHMYLSEISDFLRTLTIKDTLIADQMLNTWVNDDYKSIVEQSINAHPYYRQMLGEYIVFDHKEIRPVIEKLFDDDYLFIETNKLRDTYKNITDPDERKEFKNQQVNKILNDLFPLETKITWMSPYSSDPITRVVPNKQIYRYCNKVPIIYSYDTQTQIPYVKEFLHSNNKGIRSHANTASVYKIPQQRYIKLLSRYPAESEIIKGVTYPIDSSKLLSAENFSILNYDEHMLESTEYQSLIDCVSNTLAMIRRRYAVDGFVYENLYAQAHYYLVWQILYLALFVQRIVNIKSGSVHSYHIWKYLKSHGFEDYRDILSVTQQKFLYKNLPYINQHKGTQHALELLTYVFLTTKNMSLYAKNLMQSVDNGEDETTVKTANKYPIVQSIQVAKPSIRDINAMKRKSRIRFEKILHYLGANAGDARLTDLQEYLGGETEDINELYLRERESKLEYQDDYLFEKSTNRHTKLMTYSPTSHLNTKLLEIKSNKTINDYATIYTKFIAESLLYLAANDQLNFNVKVQLANSSRLIELPAREWVGMIFYAINKMEDNIGKDVYGNFQKERHDDNCLDYPPAYADIEWPFKLPVDGRPEIPENFYWNRKTYKTKPYLIYVSKVYDITIGNTDYHFVLQTNNNNEYIVSSPEKCEWTSGDMTLRYNPYCHWWNILDDDDKIVYHTSRSDSINRNVHLLKWFTGDESIASETRPIIESDKIYLADNMLNPYRNASSSEIFANSSDTLNEKFAEDMHNQGLNFLMAYILINEDESAISRALYDALIRNYCVNTESDSGDKKYRVNLKGKLLRDINNNNLSFEDYLKQDYANDIVVLKGVLELYDTSNDIATLYSRMIDTILDALLPYSEDLLTYGVFTLKYRYKKVIELFKSMTAYNLAYLDPEFFNYEDTKFSVHVSDFSYTNIRKTINDISCIPESLTNIVKQTWKPTYVDQDDVLQCTFTMNDDVETDTFYKQILLNYIDQITEALTCKKLSKTKKRKAIRTILDRYNITISSDFVDQVIKLPNDILFALRNTKHRICRHSPSHKIIIRERVNFFDYDTEVAPGIMANMEDVYIVKGDKPAKCIWCDEEIIDTTQTQDEED